MHLLRHAILAVLISLTSPSSVSAAPPESPPARPSPPDETAATQPAPLEVRFRLRDGMRVSGTLTAWTAEGIDGSFGRRSWTDIDHDDIWRLFRRIEDVHGRADWTHAGRALLLVGVKEAAAAKDAERAFRRARRGAGDDAEALAKVEAAIEAARADADVLRRELAAEATAAAARRLQSVTAEARPWGSAPWPRLTPAEQAAAFHTVRSDAELILEEIGLAVDPVETPQFLLYADRPRLDAARWLRHLDATYRRLGELFNRSTDENIFWGKAVVFVFGDRARYEQVERDTFGRVPPAWMDGACHPAGPKVFLNVHVTNDEDRFISRLLHETVHGYMHRYRTPRRLPPWANEGFAAHIANLELPGALVEVEPREVTIRWIRANRPVNALLDLAYTDDDWPGPNREIPAIGTLLVELMLRDSPDRFVRWVHAVKAGKDWQIALAEDYGVPRETLVDTFVRYYRVND